MVSGTRRVRADAQRNLEALREAAKEIFAESGVDAPVREIAERAGVGLGTVYRHFPQRSDLIKAVFRHEIDSCAQAATTLAAEQGPGDALGMWLLRYTGFIGTKRGLASALHSGDPAYEALPAYFDEHLVPALTRLLDAAVAAGEARSGITPDDLLRAVANLCLFATEEQSRAMVTLLIDGLRRVG